MLIYNGKNDVKFVYKSQNNQGKKYGKTNVHTFTHYRYIQNRVCHDKTLPVLWIHLDVV